VELLYEKVPYDGFGDVLEIYEHVTGCFFLYKVQFDSDILSPQLHSHHEVLLAPLRLLELWVPYLAQLQDPFVIYLVLTKPSC
jgi:hypothetical protein